MNLCTTAFNKPHIQNLQEGCLCQCKLPNRSFGQTFSRKKELLYVTLSAPKINCFQPIIILAYGKFLFSKNTIQSFLGFRIHKGPVNPNSKVYGMVLTYYMVFNININNFLFWVEQSFWAWIFTTVVHCVAVLRVFSRWKLFLWRFGGYATNFFRHFFKKSIACSLQRQVKPSLYDITRNTSTQFCKVSLQKLWNWASKNSLRLEYGLDILCVQPKHAQFGIQQYTLFMNWRFG